MDPDQMPLQNPRPGHAAEYEDLLARLQLEEETPSLWSRLMGRAHGLEPALNTRGFESEDANDPVAALHFVDQAGRWFLSWGRAALAANPIANERS